MVNGFVLEDRMGRADEIVIRRCVDGIGKRFYREAAIGAFELTAVPYFLSVPVNAPLLSPSMEVWLSIQPDTNKMLALTLVFSAPRFSFWIAR